MRRSRRLRSSPTRVFLSPTASGADVGATMVNFTATHPLPSLPAAPAVVEPTRFLTRDGPTTIE